MTHRSQATGLVVEFLQDVLAGGALGVPELEVMARAAGLLGEDKRITHSKIFKRAKRSLGIKSVRNGFGDEGEWLWLLEKSPVPSLGENDPEQSPDHLRVPLVPPTWIQGVAHLDHNRALRDIPPHRWRQFLSDCSNFLAARVNGAERAAQLGWDAKSLFGCRLNRPLMYPGSAGLVWAINGGRIVELHREWAIIELPVNKSQRIFERRSVDVGKVIAAMEGQRQCIEAVRMSKPCAEHGRWIRKRPHSRAGEALGPHGKSPRRDFQKPQELWRSMKGYHRHGFRAAYPISA